MKVIDPLELASVLWPDITFYREQQEIIYSVCDNYETVVPAGNMLGKDFVAGFLVVYFFLTRTPCRIVTTSADSYQLESVLWGEIRKFIQTSRQPLEVERGGNLIVNHLHVRKVIPSGRMDAKTQRPILAECPTSYIRGRTSAKGEGLLGHHASGPDPNVPHTLAVIDEASGVEDIAFTNMDTWAARKLIIGNPYPCNNYFKKAVKGGDIILPDDYQQPVDLP